MSETKQKSFAETLLKNPGRGVAAPDDNPESTATKERQHGAQAFSLSVRFKDGRRTQGFAWGHYGGYEWTDDGEHETLTLLFGRRTLMIEGFNLAALMRSVDEGQLKAIKELSRMQVELMRKENPENVAIVLRVQCDPPFRDIVKEIRGEDEHDTEHAGKLQRR